MAVTAVLDRLLHAISSKYGLRSWRTNGLADQAKTE
jgi:hypothetical protein